ncbi:MAG: NnrU family protein [Devosia sp.]|nr:NnrU family protein [Devosia sp.]
MLVLILGLIVFFGAHSVRLLAPGWRAAQLAANAGRWKGLYSLASLLGLVLIVWGYVIYRPQAGQLYVPPGWGRHVTMLLVWLALTSVTAAYQPVGRIKASLQNPFLIGIILWSAGHLLANGDLAGVLLFGCFFVYGVIDVVTVMGRGDPRPVFASYRGDIVSVVAGTVVYLVLVLWLHGLLFGVSPLG